MWMPVCFVTFWKYVCCLHTHAYTHAHAHAHAHEELSSFASCVFLAIYCMCFRACLDAQCQNSKLIKMMTLINMLLHLYQ